MTQEQEFVEWLHKLRSDASSNMGKCGGSTALIANYAGEIGAINRILEHPFIRQIDYNPEMQSTGQDFRDC